MTTIDCAGRLLDLSRPRVMGILNLTPDSFSDGGLYVSPKAALDQAERMVREGADIIDVGGESTRPGAMAVTLEEERRRVLPVIETLSERLSVPISVDTSKPEIMVEAVQAGAGMINDVMALRAPGALAAAAETDVPICLMHMQGEPRTMQADPRYDDVIGELSEFFRSRIDACVSQGIGRHRIILDPGFGFGKTLGHNLSMLKDLSRFSALGLPLLVGMSRKAMIGAVLDKPVAERLIGSVAAALVAASKGAALIRVHDVGPTCDALRMLQAVNDAR